MPVARQASCCVANAFSAKLKLIWQRSSLKTTKMHFFAKSRYAWVQPMKNKTGQAITDAFEKISKGTGRRKLINLQTDDGKKFYNKTFQALLKHKGIIIFRPVVTPKPVL